MDKVASEAEKVGIGSATQQEGVKAELADESSESSDHTLTKDKNEEKGDIDMDEVDADLIKKSKRKQFQLKLRWTTSSFARTPLCPLPNYTGRFDDEYLDERDACSDLSVDDKLLYVISKLEWYKTIHQIPTLVYRT